MQENDAYAELRSIRNLMERSSKFISVSGFAGVLAGIYALVGAGWAYRLLRREEYPISAGLTEETAWNIGAIALGVLVISILTSYLLSARKARRQQAQIWNPVSRRLLLASGIPFLAGGAFMVILLLRGEYMLIAPANLVFYGLALTAGSPYTYTEIRWLGIGQILLGLMAMWLPDLGLLFWAIGFGLLHILYGVFMHIRYER